jgi:hypothetical protein
MADEPYYPVKRRGDRRRLIPNQPGIEWLESEENDFDDADIEFSQQDPLNDELVFTFAYGRSTKSYARPMFQALSVEAYSSFRNIAGTACPCGDFSRSWNCEEHGELPYDYDTGRWKISRVREPAVPQGPATQLDHLVEQYRLAESPFRNPQTPSMITESNHAAFADLTITVSGAFGEGPFSYEVDLDA